MKRMKKLTSVVLALAMALSMVVFADATATVTASGAVTSTETFGVTAVAVDTEDVGLNNAVLTLGNSLSDGTIDSATVSDTDYTASVDATGKIITITKALETAATVTLTQATPSNESLATAITVKLTVTSAPETPTVTISASAAVTSTEDYGISALDLATQDTGLNDVVLTVADDGLGSGTVTTITVSDTDYSATVDATGKIITISKNLEEVATLTLTQATPSNGSSAASITIKLTVTQSGAGAGSTGVDNFDDATGSGSGKGKNEGPDPAKVINIVLPTVSANAFDMILDPHNLLKDTEYARLGGTNAVNFVTADVDNHLFFNQGTVGGKLQYGKDSVALDIINKSQIDVYVGLNVAVTKGESASDVSFVAADALSNATGAAMNLTLNSTPTKGAKGASTYDPTGTDHVKTETVDADGVANISYLLPTVNVFKRTYANDAYSYIVDSSKSDGSDADFNKTTFKLSGSINDKDDWDDVATDAIELTLTWAVTKEAGATPAANKGPSITNTVKATAAAANAAAATDANKAVFTYDLGSGDSAATGVSGMKFKLANGNENTQNAGSANVQVDTTAKTVTVIGINAIYGGSDWKIVFTKDDGTTVEVPVTLHD